MIKYFKELLATIKELLATSRKIEKHLESIAKCTVILGRRDSVGDPCIRIMHWYD